MSSSPAPTASAVQSPLNLMLTIKAGHNHDLKKYLADNSATIEGALTKVGTVHFARFLFIPGTQIFFVLTE